MESPVKHSKGAVTESEKVQAEPSTFIVADARFHSESMITAKTSYLGCTADDTFRDNSISSKNTSNSSSDDLEKGAGPIVIHHHELEDFDGEPTARERRHCSSQPAMISDGPPCHTVGLPVKRNGRIWRGLRYNLFSVYQRLFSVCLIANMATLVVLLAQNRQKTPWGPDRTHVATAAAANVLAAFLIRQEHVINALYAICCATPWWLPLRVRRVIAKFYHFGGVHSGCAVSATVWFLFFTALITKDFASGNYNQPGVVAIAHVLLALLLSMCVFAIPKFRMVNHNTFEAVHRFAGWIAVGLFWVLILLVSKAASDIPGADSLGIQAVKSPAFWLVMAVTFLTILPWLRLRKVVAFPEKLSNHAIRIHFKYMKMGPILGLRISDNPLKEWHAFASIPAADGQSFSLIVSDAGDWTKKQIANPGHAYWVRGIPITGMLRMAIVFRRIIMVTTGSGIGPVLSMLVSHPMPCRLLWSTPDPEKTYGENIMESVCKVDPDAMIINTRVSGRPDMVALAYHLYVQSNAEAVFCISNASLTRKVVYGLESRGVPAYGPIWDS
ncbi:MAG: hypothetical protein LQ345_003000 [Seirophora villosa]|nr:MAG: hypothetical protein LQ345_003000 [Seirophora villosa]